MQIYIKNYINYNSFVKFNENLYEKIFTYTRELFNIYLDILKMKKDTQEIIKKIKEKMMNLITVQSYIEELMVIFKDIRNVFPNVYYTIFINYMEILNNEGIKQLSRDNKSGKKLLRYYAKLYFEQAFFGITKFVDEEKLKTIDLDIKNQYDIQSKINQDELNKLNSFAYYIEKLIKDGQYLFDESVIETHNVNFTDAEKQDILDIFIGMANSFDKSQNTIEEAFCLANIIKMKYKYMNIRDTEKLEGYIERLRQIMAKKKVDKYPWYSRINELINNS
jgi:hypothetical protein